MYLPNKSFNLLMIFFIFTFFVLLMLLSLFFFASMNQNWSIQSASSFECGFSSYFFSRFSFSIHYFMIGLIFLFLDLELCFLFPFFKQFIASSKLLLILILIVTILILGMILEWSDGKLNWKF